ncbi:transmembrane emp24 domain-containing protein opossum [Leptinotarsa decemlineata]|uniref:transmembrane emp24 domain-containing protein opossum n=1 Tax=Leptinotarsa decemlineata TaxID=7539 RepID=UPI003D30D516
MYIHLSNIIMKQCMTIFLLIHILKYANSLERELTIFVEAGSETCFYQSARKGDTIDVEYQVIDGGHGDLDITFRLVDPTGRIILADFKKSENNHRVDASMQGDYRFCFDNSFSSYNTKTVFFELIVEGEEGNEWDSEEKFDFNAIQSEQMYELKIEDVQEIINSLRNQLSKARSLQDMIKSNEARDRNVAEENYFKVNTYSMFQLVFMLIVGFVQVIMVRSLFDDRSRVHKIWKNLSKGSS